MKNALQDVEERFHYSLFGMYGLFETAECNDDPIMEIAKYHFQMDDVLTRTPKKIQQKPQFTVAGNADEDNSDSDNYTEQLNLFD